MAMVTSRDGESIDKLLRRFKKKVEAAAILKDVRRHEFYVKPSVKKKQKQAAAAKRRRRAATRAQKS
ncbi:MAG: 30S ribosomal protein S21 [Deltaproteobacteria bacterium]|nr:30S ribosomal protein S21 [Deltaproteobacteria bacterium]